MLSVVTAFWTIAPRLTANKGGFAALTPAIDPSGVRTAAIDPSGVRTAAIPGAPKGQGILWAASTAVHIRG